MLTDLLRVLLDALEGQEEVGLVLDDGPAQAGAELVLPVLALLDAVALSRTRSCELRLLSRKYSKTEPVKLVGAALGDDLERAAVGAARSRRGSAGSRS